MDGGGEGGGEAVEGWDMDGDDVLRGSEEGIDGDGDEAGVVGEEVDEAVAEGEFTEDDGVGALDVEDAVDLELVGFFSLGDGEGDSIVGEEGFEEGRRDEDTGAVWEVSEAEAALSCTDDAGVLGGFVHGWSRL